jgi:hypothetical protein
VQSEIILALEEMPPACSGHNAPAVSSIVVALGARLRNTIAARFLSDTKSAEQISSVYMQSNASEMIPI